MARIEDGTPIMFVGKKGPADWVGHKAMAANSEGLAAAACSTKGAKRAVTVRDYEKPYVRPCVACWTDEEIRAWLPT